MIAQGLLRNRRFVIAATLLLALTIAILIAELLATKQPNANTFVSDIASIVCSLVALGFFTRTWSSTSRKEVYKKIWGMVMIGIILWALAEIIWGYYEIILGVTTPYPSIADLFWLAGYVPFYLALFIVYRTYQSDISRQQRLIVIGTSLLFFAASFFFVILPTIQGFDSSKLLESLTDIAYPLADTGLIILTLIIIFAFEEGRFSLTWQLFGVGLMLEAAGDLMFSYATWNSLYYPNNQLNALSGFVDLSLDMAYLILGLAVYSYYLIIKSLPTGKINLVLQSLTRSNFLVFITTEGKILSVSDNFSNLVNQSPTTTYTKMSLSDALGINQSQVENIIEETTKHGSVSTQLLPGGSSKEIWWTSVAVYNEEKNLDCIALVLRANPDSEEKTQISLREDQRVLIEYYLRKAGTTRIEENQVIKTYFLEQLNLLHSLVQQFNGAKMADNLLSNLQQTAHQNKWNFSYDGHNITIPEEFEGQVLADLLSKLLNEAKNFAVNRISLKLVEQEMTNLDKSLGKDTLRYVDEYALRGLVQAVP